MRWPPRGATLLRPGRGTRPAAISRPRRGSSAGNSEKASNFNAASQNGWELNLVNEAGQASRGWVDYPGRIWVARANMGAIYSPDGMTIQFDNGTIWQRAPELPPGPPPRRRRR